MRKLRGILLLLTVASTPGALAAAGAESGKPSHAPLERCAWEKASDGNVGLDAWVQRCDFGFRKIDFVFSGNSLAQRWDGGKADALVDVLELKPDEPVDAGLVRLFGERTDNALAAKCVLKPYKYYKPSPRGVKRYTFVPDKAFQKEVDAKADPNEVPEPPCGDWGDAPDGIQYFEVQAASKAARRVLFVRVGQDEPLFDEQTLKVQPKP
jgi:hypothetical protein